MKKSIVIIISVCASIVLVTCIVLSVVFAMKKTSNAPVPTPVSPQQQCNDNGYIWDTTTQKCTTNQCGATVDAITGIITGTIMNANGTKCINVSNSTYLSPVERATLLKLCQSAKFANLLPTSKGLQCTQATGCASKPYTITPNSIMNGCPYLTYQPVDTGSNCASPNSSQLEYLCNTSVNGCPLGSNLNAACDTSAPCYNVTAGCTSTLATPGCRPINEMWEWEPFGSQCVNATVNNTIAVIVTSATVDQVVGTYVLDNPPQNTLFRWGYLLTDTSSSPKSWIGPVTLKANNNFLISFNSSLELTATYMLTLQAYTSTDNSHYVLSYTSVTPNKITLTAAPIEPGLVLIKPTLSLDLAKQLATNVEGAVTAANNNTTLTNKPFVVPSTDVWNNSLQGVSTGESALIVPCTSAYCKTSISDNFVMLILAWPIVPITDDVIKEIKTKCSSLTGTPQVHYAVYENGGLVGNNLSEGSWLQPLPSDPTLTTQFQVVAYVYTGTDTGVENSTCKSQALNVTVQVPTDLYSISLCYNIKPFKPLGTPIPGNFMLYHPGSNICSQPVDSAEALKARDFSCLITQTNPNLQTPPTLQNMQLYGCNDIGKDTDNCESSDQGCETITPVTSVRQPNPQESIDCKPPVSGTVPACGGLQYCQQAACNCPNSVIWPWCGVSTYASVGDNAIEAGRWQTRVSGLHNFITNYGLDTVVDVQKFLNDSTASEDIKSAWDATYGSAVCPLPKWSAPNFENCDVTSATACQQNTVCESWQPDTSIGSNMYKQEIVEYPTLTQNSSCCLDQSTYLAGCCCPNTDTGSTCDAYKDCKPLASGTLGPTWCATK